MMNKHFSFPKKLLILNSGMAIALYISLMLSLAHHRPLLNWQFWGAIILTLISTTYTIIDIEKNQRKNKRLWLLCVIFLLALGSFIYLLQRKENNGTSTL